MLDRQWKNFNEKYSVSSDGMVCLRTSSGAGPAGRMLMPGVSGGSVIYFISEGRSMPARQVTMAHMMMACWGVKVPNWDEKTLLARRAEAREHNGKLMSTIDEKKQAAEQCFKTKREVVEIDFSTMATNCLDVGTWDDPRMDQMTHRGENGVWFYVPKTETERRKIRSAHRKARRVAQEVAA